MRQNKQNPTAVSLHFPVSAPDSLLADVGGAADVLVGGDEERRVHGAGAADDAALQHRARLGAQREAAALVIVRLVRVAAGPRAVTAVNTRWRDDTKKQGRSWVVMWVVTWHIRRLKSLKYPKTDPTKQLGATKSLVKYSTPKPRVMKVSGFGFRG